MLILLIVSFLSFLNFSHSYLSIPFKVKSNLTKDEKDIMPYLLFKGIYIDIKIGSKNEEFSLPLKMKVYPCFISSSSSKIKSKKFNEQDSETYIKLDNNSITSKEDLIEGYKSLDKISIDKIILNEYNFILTENQIIDESGGIGLKISPTFSEYGIYRNISNFITQLKKNNLINSYSFSFNYKNENEGLFIIGAEPHEFDPKHYNENNSISVRSSINYGGGRWVINLKNATYNEKQIFVGPTSQLEILSEIQLIFGVNYFKKVIFNDFFNQNGCSEGFSEEYSFNYFYCDEKKIDIKKFSDVIFTTEKKNQFIFNYKDLFYNYKGFNYFLIVFGKDSWIFGQIFLRKYYSVFNSEKKIVKFYFYEQKNGYLNILLLICVLFFLISFSLIVYIYYFKKKFIFKKKKRANELEDDYEYISGKMDLKTDKNKLFSNII